MIVREISPHMMIGHFVVHNKFSHCLNIFFQNGWDWNAAMRQSIRQFNGRQRTQSREYHLTAEFAVGGARLPSVLCRVGVRPAANHPLPTTKDTQISATSDSFSPSIVDLTCQRRAKTMNVRRESSESAIVAVEQLCCPQCA